MRTKEARGGRTKRTEEEGRGRARNQNPNGLLRIFIVATVNCRSVRGWYKPL